MAIHERKRSRMTGRGGQPSFLKLLHHVIDSPEFGALKGSALKMLIDLARQYNGKNNGNLRASLLRQSGRWKSEDTMSVAIDQLVDGGWLVKTKQGGMGIGPSLFAVTWWPIDACEGRHDHPIESVASNLWNKKLPHRNPVDSTPKSGVRASESCSESDQLTPESGAKTAISKAA